MNCKPGDLAMIRAFDDEGPLFYAGRVVTCVEFVGYLDPKHRFDDWWRIDRSLGPDHDGYVCDSILIPIRGEDVEDEVPEAIGKPEGVTA